MGEIIAIILASIGIIVTLIVGYFSKHTLDDFRKAMQELWITFTKHSITIGKCTICSLIPVSFIHMCVIQAHKEVFTPEIYTSIGDALVSFIVISPILFLIIFVIEPFLSAFLLSKAPK